MKEGVVYIATGQKYIGEALKSAASLKGMNRSVHVTVFSDREIDSPYVDGVVRIEGAEATRKPQPVTVRNGGADPVAGRQPKGMFNKVSYMGQSPYERTLFLDSDTYIAGEISDLFELLDSFDIAVAHAPHRSPRSSIQRKRFARIPPSFVMMNTGVLLFKNSERVSTFFADWLRSYQEDVTAGEYNDQTSFREALYTSDLRVAMLPPEYNYRFHKRLCINGSLKILHGRHPNLPLVARKVGAMVTRGLTPPLVASRRLGAIKRLLGGYLTV
jgi:hypothetical protein